MQGYLSEITARWLLVELARTTLLVAVLGAAVWLVLRLARIKSPTLHRMCCVMVLLAGWSFVRWPVDVAWYDAPPVVAEVDGGTLEVAQKSESFTPPIDPALLSPPPELGAGIGAPALAAPEVDAATTEPQFARQPDPMPEVTVQPAWRVAWAQVTVAVWLLGIVAVVTVWLVGYLRFLWQFPSGSEEEPEWRAEFDAAMAEQGRAGDVEFRVTEDAGPLLCRLPRRTVLLVPHAMWSALDAVERRAILRHELEHLSRGDLWKSLAVRVLALPHWFNPVAWLAVRRFDDAAEWACDRAAMASEPTSYAAMLLRLGELAGTRAKFGSAMSNRPLTTRIRRLLTLGGTEDSAMKKACLISLLLVIAPLALVRVNLVAEEPEANPFGDPPQQAADTEDPFAGTAAEPQANDQNQQPAAGENVPPAEPPRDAEPDTPVKAAHWKMVEFAKKTYEANDAAYKAGTVILGEVFHWSNLWLSSELALVKSREEQLAAAQRHLARMKVLEANIRRLFEQGSRGGEANAMYAASFYVADAERRLAEIEAMREPQANAVQPEGDDAMLVAAARGYESTLAAYQAGNATLETVIAWSNRWLAADLEFARSREEQLAAARAHFRRIRDIHQKIAALYRTGSRGGEAPAMATADYYLADAERRVKEIESSPQTARATPAAVVRVAQPSSTFEGQQLTTPGKPTLPPPSQDSSPSTPPREAYPDPYGSSARPTPARTAPKSGSSPTFKPTDAAPALKSKRPRSREFREGMPTLAEEAELKYDGKSFDQWREQLQTDLSPTRRTEAIKAIGEFAAHGYGKQVIEALFETMHDYSMASIDVSHEGLLKTAALAAGKKVPTADRMPAILEALQSDNQNERLFALSIIPEDAPKAEIVPLLEAAVSGPDPQIASFARNQLFLHDHDNATLIAAIRDGLESNDERRVQSALYMARGIVAGQSARSFGPNPELLPLALALIDHSDPAIQNLAIHVLSMKAPEPGQTAYVEALEQIASSDEGKAAVNARKMLDRISQPIDRRR